MAAAAKAVRISVVSDTVCPWCFVGKKNLCVTGGTNAQATRHRLTLSCSEKALASLPKTQATVEWKPYLLGVCPLEGNLRAFCFDSFARAVQCRRLSGRPSPRR